MITGFYTKGGTDVKKNKIQKKKVGVKIRKKRNDKGNNDTGVVTPVTCGGDTGGEAGDGRKLPTFISEFDEDAGVKHQWTVDELTYIKDVVPTLEEHQRLQIIHFMYMDGINHTTTNDGVMMNLTKAPPKFLEKLTSFLSQTERDMKYRELHN